MFKTIGVIGAGQMGSGITHVCALAGYEVRMLDVDPAALERAVGVIDRNLGRQVASGKIGETDKSAALKHIHTSSDYAAFRDCDIVIEAATEKEAVKREI
ncbi:MAG: 3-hydroxyacyl-CoA dehydrogenase NAD-binding domain-containing protein, partial [Acidobacteriota bacterium]